MQKRHFRIIIELEKSEIIMIMITWTYANLYLISNHYFKQIQLTRCHRAVAIVAVVSSNFSLITIHSNH